MPAGFQVFNDSGVIQIDENTLNFVLTAKGSSNCNTLLNSGYNVYYRDIVVTGVSPVLALRGAHHVFVLAVTNSGSSWTFRVGGGNSTAFDYYVFDRAIGSYGTSGIQIFTAAGDLAYHSDAKPMRVVDFVPRGQSDTYSYTSGRIYAAIQANPGAGQTEPDDITGEFDMLLAASFSVNHTITIEDFVSRHGTTGSIGGDFYEQSMFTIVDVTNY